MGDRTYADITLRKSDYDNLLSDEERKKIEEEYEEEILDDDLMRFIDYEANYGQIDPIKDVLVEKEIEYTLTWASGSEYSAGSEFGRLVNGEYMMHSLYDDGETMLYVLKHILKQEDIKKAVEDKINELEPFKVEPLDKPITQRFIEET